MSQSPKEQSIDQATVERAFFGALSEKNRKGDAHISVPKFVELLGLPVTQANCNAAAEVLREAFNEYSPSTTVIITR
jgi:hypothetical protein